MQTTTEINYPAPLQKTWEILSNPDFLTARITDYAPLPAEANVHPTDRGHVALTTITILPEKLKLPAIAAKFIPEGGTKITIREDWDKTTLSSTLEVETGPLPVTISGYSRLEEQTHAGENTTLRTTEIEVKISIPIFGKKIEQTAVANIAKLVTAETKTFAKFN